MCHADCAIFISANLLDSEIKNKKIIEIGSYNVNGSVRSFVESRKPSKYVGVDIENGPGVDVVCSVENIIEKYGEGSFDIVISTEMIEHVKDWRRAISNIKNICKPGGIALITTRSMGFPYHGHPHDFWRYEIEDMRYVFSDCDIKVLEKDPHSQGVFLKFMKPDKFKEKKLNDYRLHSVIIGKKTREVSDERIRKFHNKYKRKANIRNFVSRIKSLIFGK